MIGSGKGIKNDPTCRNKQETKPEAVIEKKFSINVNGFS
jgi:hypothetical protein